MAKSTKKRAAPAAAKAGKSQVVKAGAGKLKTGLKAKTGSKAKIGLKAKSGKAAAIKAKATRAALPPVVGSNSAAVLDRLWGVVMSRRGADPRTSHSARLLSRGTAKVAQKLGEEAVECVIEAVAGNREPLIGESADVLYHLLVVWVDAGIRPDEVWAELVRREGISGIVEKAGRARAMPLFMGGHTSKIP